MPTSWIANDFRVIYFLTLGEDENPANDQQVFKDNFKKIRGKDAALYSADKRYWMRKRHRCIAQQAFRGTLKQSLRRMLHKPPFDDLL